MSRFESVEPSPQCRGQKVVDKVIEATLEELSLVGYGALSVESVAARAGVNKTTVYRRWATKIELVRAAVVSVADETIVFPDQGSLRDDLLAAMRSFLRFAHTPRGQSLMRMVHGADPTSELALLARSIRESKDRFASRVIEQAILRGELPKGTDPQLVFGTLAGSLQHMLVFQRQTVSEERLEALIDLVLNGAKNGGGLAPAPARPTSQPR